MDPAAATYSRVDLRRYTASWCEEIALLDSPTHSAWNRPVVALDRPHRHPRSLASLLHLCPRVSDGANFVEAGVKTGPDLRAPLREICQGVDHALGRQWGVYIEFDVCHSSS